MEPGQTINNNPASVPTPTVEPVQKPEPNMMAEGGKKKSNGMLYGMILCAVLAVCGIGFGVWAMMDGNNQVVKKDEQIASLNKQINELETKTTTIYEQNKSSDSLNNNTINNNGDSDLCGSATIEVTVNAWPGGKRCEGVYYGESGSLKYTYTLKDDGSFIADYSGVSGTHEVYTINDNTISMTGMAELGGPRDQVTYYMTEDAIIADDCSSIKLTKRDGFELKKQ